MGGSCKSRLDRFWVIAQIYFINFVARRHNRTDGEIAQHDAGNHFFLAWLNNACVFRLNHQRADFILTYLLRYVASMAQNPEDRLAQKWFSSQLTGTILWPTGPLRARP